MNLLVAFLAVPIAFLTVVGCVFYIVIGAWFDRRRISKDIQRIHHSKFSREEEMTDTPNADVLNLLKEAHDPCPHLHKCNEDWRKNPEVPDAQLWQPERGLVPCSFCGAFGEVDDVELIIVIAEPGNKPQERFSPDEKGPDLLKKVTDNSYRHLLEGTEPYHRQLVKILQIIFGDSPLPEKLRRTWIMSSVLCPIPPPLSSTSPVPEQVETRCSSQYLFRAIRLFPNAEIVALGDKAHARLKQLARRSDAPEALTRAIKAMHPSARTVNNPERSWHQAAEEFWKLKRERGRILRPFAKEIPSMQAVPVSGSKSDRPAPRAEGEVDRPVPIGRRVTGSVAVADSVAQKWLRKTYSIAPGVTFDRVSGFACPSACAKTGDGWIEREDRRRPRPPYQRILVALQSLGGTASGFEIVELVRDVPRQSQLSPDRYWSEYLRDGSIRHGPYFTAK